MRTYRGVVCEKKNKYTVFLTEKGEFLRGVPIGKTPDIGDEVDFHLVFTPALFGVKVKPRFAGAVMIAAMLLLAIVASLIPMNDKVMAYVQLENGMALEFGVNQAGEVITLRYLNDKPIEYEEKLDDWKGRPISTVLNTAVTELSAENNGVQVIITTIFPDAKNQQKVQGIVGSAVREVRNANQELTIEIGESTAEERVKANQHEMSIHKFKASQQSPPMNEKKPSTEINDDKTNSGNQQKGQDGLKKPDKQSVPSAPADKKNNGNEERKNSNELKDPKLKKPDTKPKNEQDEKLKYSPAEKEKLSNPASENKNSNKGNQNPASKQPKGNQNPQKQNGLGNQAPPAVGNSKK
ncbi:anti-sigma factor domain-containing protein [Sporosarcina beigongshangi]|uniref:anti-sigma factor domain-containing protein n=1 Tax=Sporosarcina beigongshangi TaxID=2782538 RepID=UPI0019395720|nr:anti-sigma factor domain-containing protein [Sporosarcina beigongshangi]